MIRIKTGGIYLIKHTSGYFYIGLTTDFSTRWGGHLTQLIIGTHHSDKFQSLFRKTKIEEWSFHILKHLSKTEVRQSTKLKGKELEKIYNTMLKDLEKEYMGMYDKEMSLNTQNKWFK